MARPRKSRCNSWSRPCWTFPRHLIRRTQRMRSPPRSAISIRRGLRRYSNIRHLCVSRPAARVPAGTPAAAGHRRDEMIASLSGKLRRKGTDYLVVDVSGVGYQVHVPLSTYCGIPEQGDNISLHIHTHLREDSLSLFGFLTESEKDMFLLLMGVSGIGPKLALAVLSSLSVADLSCAIGASDDAKLCAVPGIGKKTAARMVLELKDKMVHLLTSMN